MPATRITVVKNANQTVKSVLLLQVDPDAPDRTLRSILELSEKKLRLKRPSRIFLDDGTELTKQQGVSRILNGTTLLISCGEPFCGTSKALFEEDHRPKAMVRFIGSTKFQSDHVDSQAFAQLNAVAKLSGITHAIAMPDLHPGDKFPIGAVFESVGCIYPALIGGDVGCGMALFQTRLATSTNTKRLCDKLRGIEGVWREGSPQEWLAKYVQDHQGLPSFYEHLGTIGGGNHFAEIQQVESILDREMFINLGLEEDKLALLVHSGSRGLGQHIAKDQPVKLLEGTSEFEEYLKQHDFACSWAKANRDLIAHRILDCLGIGASKVLDIWHNNVTRKNMGHGVSQQAWIHRKGAAPSDQGAVAIPGSRGALSYLVAPIGEQRDNLFSIAHGAGRRLTRGTALSRMHKKATSVNASAAALLKTAVGSKVICEDVNLLFEEAPEAYKDVEAVVEELVSWGVIKVVAMYKPVVTYKKRIRD